MTIAPKLLRYLLPCLSLSACASYEPPPNFGATVRAAFARQVIALPSATPVSGIDGAAALQAQQAYRKSFAEREPPVRPLVIGVGGQK
jgi:hypothetical protein